MPGAFKNSSKFLKVPRVLNSWETKVIDIFCVPLPAFLQFALLLVGLMGRQIVARGMGPFFVVDLHSSGNFCFGDLEVLKNLIQQKLCFKNSIDAFGLGIVIRRSALGHADLYVVFTQQGRVRLRAILHSPIGVVHELPLGVLSGAKGRAEGFDTKSGIQGRRQLPAHDAT